MSDRANRYSENLRAFLESESLPHRFIEFEEPVKTVEQASRKVPPEQIAKSIILIDSNNEPFMAILLAMDRISYRRVKEVLGVKDVRLATENEVMTFSGYPVGGVPPFNQVKRALLDPKVLKNRLAIFGGGDVNKLVELRTSDIVDIVKPVITDLTRKSS